MPALQHTGEKEVALGVGQHVPVDKLWHPQLVQPSMLTPGQFQADPAPSHPPNHTRFTRRNGTGTKIQIKALKPEAATFRKITPKGKSGQMHTFIRPPTLRHLRAPTARVQFPAPAPVATFLPAPTLIGSRDGSRNRGSVPTGEVWISFLAAGSVRSPAGVGVWKLNQWMLFFCFPSLPLK